MYRAERHVGSGAIGLSALSMNGCERLFRDDVRDDSLDNCYYCRRRCRLQYLVKVYTNWLASVYLCC
ncbi:MAG: hypothetical protein GPOALKHO_000235 [Sodalis sp.]|nr:MAG: hypothetical protein GPOALKHO_000235 [Sodalis sp.]